MFPKLGSTEVLPQHLLWSYENVYEPHPKSTGSECVQVGTQDCQQVGTRECVQVGLGVSQTPQGILTLTSLSITNGRN